MKPQIPPYDFLLSRSFVLRRAFPFVLAFLILAVPLRPQSQQPTASIADAARSIREQKSSSVKPARIFTNEEFEERATSVNPDPSETTALPTPTLNTTVSLPKSNTGECKSPNAQRLEAELQSAQQELEQLRRDLAYKPVVISDGDVDLGNFRSGSSGLNVGAPPVAQSQPLAPQRIAEVELEEKISSLKKDAAIACDTPEDGRIQQKIDTAEQELHTLQNEFALDQSAYYSKPDYAEDLAGKARLDAEQQRIMDLQSEIQGLKTDLATPK